MRQITRAWGLVVLAALCLGGPAAHAQSARIVADLLSIPPSRL